MFTLKISKSIFRISSRSIKRKIQLFSSARNFTPLSILPENKEILELIFDDVWQEVTCEIPQLSKNYDKKNTWAIEETQPTK